MQYTPTPYSEAKHVSSKSLAQYHEHEVSLECENPEDPEGDLIEHEFSLFFSMQGAEPDVGIFSEYIDDFFYCMSDGSPVPEAVWIETDKINSGTCKAIDAWHERNCERALEGEL